MLEIKKTKQRADGLISRLGMAEETISELENMPIETSKTEKQREKKKSRTDYPRTVKQPLKHNIYILEREKRERDKRNI